MSKKLKRTFAVLLMVAVIFAAVPLNGFSGLDIFNALGVEADASVYILAYDANGGSGAPSRQTGDSSYFTVSSTVPTRFGYTFLGWAKSRTASSAAYEPLDRILVTSSITTLYAVWKAAAAVYVNTSNTCNIDIPYHQYYYTFTPSSGGSYIFESSGSLDTQIYLYNSSGTLIGDDDDGSSSGNNFRLKISLTAGTKYYIGIKAYSNRTGSTSFKVSLEQILKPEVSISSTNNISSSQTVTLDMTDNAGVVAYYWGTSSSPSSSSYTSISSTVSTAIQKTVTEAGTYYLIVKDEEGNYSATASITFFKTTLNAGSGSVSPSAVLTKSGSSFTLPSAKRSDRSFRGWSTSSSASSVSYSGGSTYTPTSSRTLYAVWESVTLSKIQVKSNPSKSTYYVGESLNTSGLSLLLTYSDSSTKTVSSGFSVSGFSSSSVGTKTVTVTYENKSTTFTVEVKKVPELYLKYDISGKEMTVDVCIKGYKNGETGDITLEYNSDDFGYKKKINFDYGNTITDNKNGTANTLIWAIGDYKNNQQLIGFYTNWGYHIAVDDFTICRLLFEIKNDTNPAAKIKVFGRGESSFMKSGTVSLDLSVLGGKLMGDTDGDKVVSAADARLVLRYSVGLEALGEAQLIYANMDYDESISSADARLILRTSVGLEASSKHDFQKNGNYYKCTDCSKQFHFHKYAHHNCYSSQKCFCGAENGVLAGHKFDLKNLKCSSCNVELAALGEKAYTAVKAINQIKTDRKNAYDAYNKKDYSKFMLSGYSVASNYAVVGNALEKNKDFENVYNDFADGARVLRDVTIKVHNSSTGVLDTSPNSVELMKKALDEVEKYEKEAVKSLLAMVEPYEDLLNGIEGLDSLIKLF